MTEHSELVKKYLADNFCVSFEEFEAAKAAWASTKLEELEAYEEAAFYASKVAGAGALAVAFTDDDDYVEYCKNEEIKATTEYEELTK